MAKNEIQKMYDMIGFVENQTLSTYSTNYFEKRERKNRILWRTM